MKFKVAVVQFKINQFQPEENLKRVEKFIQQASGKADIIVFPEDFVTGTIMKEQKFVDFDEKYKKIFVNLAKKYEIDIITGSFIEGTKTGWYNTTYYIDSCGKVKGKYRKANLWLAERKYLTPGNEISVFNTKFGKIGLTICWDLMFPEIFRRMTNRGAKIIFCPSYWLRKDARHGLKWNYNAEIVCIDSLCSARSIENGIFLIYCNAAGKFKIGKNYEDELVGSSQICSPFIGQIKKLGLQEGMFIQEVDTSILEDAEKAYKIRADLKKRIL